MLCVRFLERIKNSPYKGKLKEIIMSTMPKMFLFFEVFIRWVKESENKMSNRCSTEIHN